MNKRYMTGFIIFFKKINMKCEAYFHMKVISTHTPSPVCLKHNCLKKLKTHDQVEEEAFII